MKIAEQLGQDRIFRRPRDQQVKFPVEQHHVVDVAQGGPMLGALEDVGELRQVGVAGMLCCQPGAVRLVDQPDLDDLENLVEADRLDDHPLRGITSTMPSTIRAIQRLVNRRAADLEHGG